MVAVTGWGRAAWGEGPWGEPAPVLVTGEQADSFIGEVDFVIGTVFLITGEEAESFTGTVDFEFTYRVLGEEAVSSIGLIDVSADANTDVSGVEALSAINSVRAGRAEADWFPITPDQDGNYAGVNPAQASGFTTVTPSQAASYAGVTPTQSAGWSTVTPTQDAEYKPKYEG